MKDEAHREIVRYHDRTKHHFQRYARSAGHMDWENQPNPFRIYEDTVSVPLPLLKKDPHLPHMSLFQNGSGAGEPFNLPAVAQFLELSLGLSAWKAYGRSRWSLRMNPSSGNLHPTELHLALYAVDGIRAGLYHYNPLMHSLELRADIPPGLCRSLSRHFPETGFLAALSSIIWRESWKYGERALRYCNHDVGHALGALRFSASLQNWQVNYLGGLSDADIDTVLGFDRTTWEPLEEEHPDLICCVRRGDATGVPQNLPPEIVEAFSKLTFYGKPNRLSPKRVDWRIIYQTARHSRKPRTQEVPDDFAAVRSFIDAPAVPLGAVQIIRQRRSATAFDPDGTLDKALFFAILDKTLARRNCPPFDVALGDSAVHLFLFVHNVSALPRGLYFLCRNPQDLPSLRAHLRSDFLWEETSPDLPLYLLEAGDFRQQAARLCCHQEIAGTSLFSLGMLARFDQSIRLAPYRYRHLFWETGLVGQTLYLEAEARGVRGTGIGCFFDDPTHDRLGLKDHTWQSLYHFTIGRPIEDPRLTTLPAYHHLQPDRDAD